MSTVANVTLVPNKETGALVIPFKSNPEMGYYQVSSTSITIDGGWVREQKRSALVKGSVTLLEMYLKMNAKGLNMPGRIAISEFTESNVPADFRKRFYREDLTEEENIIANLKTAGKDGDALTCKGERIVRFSTYDPSGTAQDIRVQHDNGSTLVKARPAANLAQETPAADDAAKASDAAADDIISAAGEDAPF